AEDGIRDRNVTGVQTCALPISDREIAGLRQLLDQMEQAEGDLAAFARLDSAFHAMVARLTRSSMMQQIYQIIDDAMQSAYRQNEIGRASCRERVHVREGRGGAK